MIRTNETTPSSTTTSTEVLYSGEPSAMTVNIDASNVATKNKAESTTPERFDWTATKYLAALVPPILCLVFLVMQPEAKQLAAGQFQPTATLPARVLPSVAEVSPLAPGMVPSEAPVATTITTAAVQPQTVVVGNAFQPTEVPVPERSDLLTRPRTNAVAEAEVSIQTEQRLPPPTTARVTDLEAPPRYNLANLRSRGWETRTLELPFGYADCRNWIERWVLRTIAGYKACGPYLLSVDVTANFSSADLLGGVIQIPYTVQVASKTGPENGFPHDIVWLAIDDLGNAVWPTQAEIAQETENIPLGGIGPWQVSEISYDERYRQVIASVCLDSGLVAEVFQFGESQANFVGGC